MIKGFIQKTFGRGTERGSSIAEWYGPWTAGLSLALNTSEVQLFQGIPWSTQYVLGIRDC